MPARTKVKRKARYLWKALPLSERYKLYKRGIETGAIAKLPDRWQKVLRLRFGKADVTPSFVDLSDQLGASPTSVRYIELRATRVLHMLLNPSKKRSAVPRSNVRYRKDLTAAAIRRKKSTRKMDL